MNIHEATPITDHEPLDGTQDGRFVTYCGTTYEVTSNDDASVVYADTKNVVIAQPDMTYLYSRDGRPLSVARGPVDIVDGELRPAAQPVFECVEPTCQSGTVLSVGIYAVSFCLEHSSVVVRCDTNQRTARFHFGSATGPFMLYTGPDAHERLVARRGDTILAAPAP